MGGWNNARRCASASGETAPPIMGTALSMRFARSIAASGWSYVGMLQTTQCAAASPSAPRRTSLVGRSDWIKSCRQSAIFLPRTCIARRSSVIACSPVAKPKHSLRFALTNVSCSEHRPGRCPSYSPPERREREKGRTQSAGRIMRQTGRQQFE
jgi:hypothetical protein